MIDWREDNRQIHKEVKWCLQPILDLIFIVIRMENDNFIINLYVYIYRNSYVFISIW